jgi:hypothetical protein
LVDVVASEALIGGSGTIFFGYAGCPPVADLDRRGVNSRRSCQEFNRLALHEIINREEVATVFLVARHSVYLKGSTKDYGPAERNDGLAIELIEMGGAKTVPVSMDGYFERLDKVVSLLKDSGKDVVLVYPVPEVGFDVPRSMALLKARGEAIGDRYTPRLMYEQRQSGIRERLGLIAGKYRLSVVDPEKVLCGRLGCRISDGDTMLYSDDDHLSGSGALLLQPAIRDALSGRRGGS